jgi:ppGpp synthetase/RelA/SpoT-type nucleotidyltranferase
MTRLTRSQVDRLGERLKQGPISEDDLRLLDEYRLSFRPAYDAVVTAIRGRLQVEVTGRPAKSTTSLVAKLLRESARLTQIQDIAGCRIVVADIDEQDRIVAALLSAFPGAKVIDRRQHPSHGYTAVHIVPAIREKLVEIQVRSRLQHLWAEFSERLSDSVGTELKYGGGPTWAVDILNDTSQTVTKFEHLERSLSSMHDPDLSDAEIRDRLTALRARISAMLMDAIVQMETQKRNPR